jgi:inhibitor of cysteine peptidase
MEAGREIRRAVFAVLLASLVLLAGCGGGGLAPAETPEPGANPEGEIILTAEDNGGQVALDQGQVLVVSLASNPSTGYGWEVTEVDESILRQEGEPEFVAPEAGATPLVGAGGTEIFRFVVAGSGQTNLTLAYRRSWEEGVEPLETYSVQVLGR